MKQVDEQIHIPRKKPLLGVMGGMGTQATACFYEKLHSLQSVATEQEYLDVLVFSKPSIPDRTAYITGKSDESPLEQLTYVALTLETAGATCIALPCVTSHYFYNDILENISIPLLHIPAETAGVIEVNGVKKVCLLATDGTLAGKVFHTTFEQNGIDILLPSEEEQSNLMKIIYDIKRGEEVPLEYLESITAKPLSDGAEAVVLGCTELCILADTTGDKVTTTNSIKNSGMINTIEVLAEAAIKRCRGTT